MELCKSWSLSVKWKKVIWNYWRNIKVETTTGLQWIVNTQSFCEEILGKIDAELSSFSGTGQCTNSIGSLESVDNFGASEHFCENFDGEAINWSGVEDFHCMKMSLSLWWACGLFSAMIEMTRHIHHVFTFWQWFAFNYNQLGN